MKTVFVRTVTATRSTTRQSASTSSAPSSARPTTCRESRGVGQVFGYVDGTAAALRHPRLRDALSWSRDRARAVAATAPSRGRELGGEGVAVGVREIGDGVDLEVGEALGDPRADPRTLVRGHRSLPFRCRR